MRKIFKILACCLAMLHIQVARSQGLRSDTVDIIHTKIHNDITDLSSQEIGGYALLRCAALMNGVHNLNLDLLSFTVDSVVDKGRLNYQYNDTLLRIDLGTVFQAGDTFEVIVYYHGKPFRESWGGFRFDADHAFQLGVGFNTDPHSLGRSWFPCFDNFVERCTFTYEIITATGRTSYCNGELTAQVSLAGDTIMRTWEMREAIPSYLANVAVSDYEELTWTHQGMVRSIPVQLAVRAQDSANLRASFAHLDEAIQSFEDAFGPYRFNKVGYSIVPMSGGMEHASNISYARNLVNGNLSRENIMAHELAHMWWGDLVTCDKEGEMWINEGMASYCEHLFYEDVYGRDRYLKEVKANFNYCIQYLHITENQYWPIQGIPHSMTYSSHVYDKGAEVVHSLRGYMGDSLFFTSMSLFLDQHAFSPVNSILMRDELEKYSGLDLHNFFDDWVFAPGYADFSIDSMKVSSGPALNQVDLYIHQKKRGSDHFCQGVPLTVTFYDGQFNSVQQNITVSGELSSFSFSLPIAPQTAFLNEAGDLNISPSSDQEVFSAAGTHTYDNAKWEIQVQGLTDSVLFRVEHHWAWADPATSEYRISPDRYWEVKGIGEERLSADAIIFFDGRNITSGGIGNLDNGLLANGTDSIVLMYRRDASQDWSEYKYYQKVQFGPSPFGRMELDSVLFGQYAFGKGQSYLGKEILYNELQSMRLYPNPANQRLRIENLSALNDGLDMLIFNSAGQLIWNQEFRNPTDVDTSTFRPGTYFVIMNRNGRQVWAEQFIVSP